jgi:hypothetical protein
MEEARIGGVQGQFTDLLLGFAGQQSAATAPVRVVIVHARDALPVLGDRRSSPAAKSFSLRTALVGPGILEP